MFACGVGGGGGDGWAGKKKKEQHQEEASASVLETAGVQNIWGRGNRRDEAYF